MNPPGTGLPPAAPVVLVLAAGAGRRFQASGGVGSKLDALLWGRPVLEHTLAAVARSGLPWHVERGPQGQGHADMGSSIAAAVAACPGAPGWLVLPGDLPRIQPCTLQAVAQALQALVRQRPGVALAVGVRHNGQPGHPVGFSAPVAPWLLNLQQKQGAALIKKQFLASEIEVTDAGCVTDVDTLQDLQRLSLRP